MGTVIPMTDDRSVIDVVHGIAANFWPHHTDVAFWRGVEDAYRGRVPRGFADDRDAAYVAGVEAFHCACDVIEAGEPGRGQG